MQRVNTASLSRSLGYQLIAALLIWTAESRIDSYLIRMYRGQREYCGRRVVLLLHYRHGCSGFMNSDALIYQIFSTFNYHVKVLLIGDLGSTLLTPYRCSSRLPVTPVLLHRDFGLGLRIYRCF